MFKSRKGQSTIEYVILVTAVIVVALGFLGNGGLFRTALNATFVQATNGMEDMANRLRRSRCNLNNTSKKCQ